MKIAVIPARGGSKRIPRKNIKTFCGRPMIAWSIDAALKSGCFDQVVVSTDDAEIAQVARNCGAQVPFLRPQELSDDYTGTTAVVAHAIEWFMEQGAQPSQVCCIYATAPFLTADDLSKGLELLDERGCDYIFSATSYAFPIQRALGVDGAGRVHMFDSNMFAVRSQDLEEAFHDAGQFYWGRAEAWLDNRIIFGPNSSILRLPRFRVQDIDTEEDWQTAEYLFEAVNR